MKVEMGESLLLSWLRHVRHCQLVQLNWKPSRVWEREGGDLADTMERAARHFWNCDKRLDLFKGTKTVSQLINQAEVDALGVRFDARDRTRLIAMDIAYHEGGLLYGDQWQTASNVAKKLLRTAFVLRRYFNASDGEVIFASPFIRPNDVITLSTVVDELHRFGATEALHFDFRVIGNGDFAKEIWQPVAEVAPKVADTSELLMRAVQLHRLCTAKRDTPGVRSMRGSVRDESHAKLKGT
jgi:hypothetical protein